eukprot:1884630-Heterocapsa_arctica.AAC.1
MHSCISTQYLYTLMISCKVGDQDDCLGHILYEDLGNKSYSMALESCVENNDALWLREDKKGDLIECILAL